MTGNQSPARGGASAAAPDVFDEILSRDPVLRAMLEAEDAPDGWPRTEDPDECIEALLEEGEPPCPDGGAASPGPLASAPQAAA